MLNQGEKENILKSFPNIKLSYEKIIHKKVSNSDLILAIPEGAKCFGWFTLLDDKPVCIILELDYNNKKRFTDIKIASVCFSSSLCYGTIIYGTLFKYADNSFFCIEDIFLYKGQDISGENWKNKFDKILTMFKNDIKQISYNDYFIIFGLPIMATSNDELDSLIKTNVRYKLHSIQYIQLNKINYCLSLLIDNFTINEVPKAVESNIYKIKINQKIEINTNIELNNNNIEMSINRNIIFIVKPDIQNDIYHLYCHNGEYYGIACIPDYKTSVMMNNHFRTIKENNDLDKLEESDDEEEFENPNIDKFVNLDKSYKFECLFNKRFKKWTPYKIVNNNNDVSSVNDVKNFINNLSSKQTKYYK